MFLYPYSHTVHFTESNSWNQDPNQESRVTFTGGNGRPLNNGKTGLLETVTTTGVASLQTITPMATFFPTTFQDLDLQSDQKPILADYASPGTAAAMTEFNTVTVQEKCRTCGEEMVPSDIIQHMRNHMGPRRCEVCNYEAPTKHHLREHLNTHTGLKPYRCTFCEKSFAAKNSLRVHTMYLHTKVRAHQCHFCDQRFVTTSERKSHELVHTDKCPVCQMSFRLRGHLRQHMKSHANAAFHHKKR